MRGLALAVDDDLDLGDEVNSQADACFECAEGADGLSFDEVAVDGGADLLAKRFGDHGAGDRAVEFAVLTGFDAEGDVGALEQVGQSGHFLVLLSAPHGGFRADILDLFQGTGSSQDSHSLGDEVITAITIGNFLYIAGAAQLVDVFDQENFHGDKPFRKGVECPGAKGTTRRAGRVYHKNKGGQSFSGEECMWYTGFMIEFIRTTLNPAGYHGNAFSPPFFEGWYFKLVDHSQQVKLAVIPGIFRSNDSAKTHAFVQVLDGVSGGAYYRAYTPDEFRVSRNGFMLEVGDNRFSQNDIKLALEVENRSFRGEVIFENPGPTGWPVNLVSPGIMGWYAWVPFMQCYHGVVSLDHGLRGSVEIDGLVRRFDGGRGYIEKDWGRSFPSAWIWFQSNHFERTGVCVTASVATIPWLGSAFTGFIVGVWLGGRLYRFTTYAGARIERLEVNEQRVFWRLSNRNSALELTASRAGGDLLRAPTPEGMDRRIAETLDGIVDMRLWERGSLIFEGRGRNAGLEVVGELQRAG